MLRGETQDAGDAVVDVMRQIMPADYAWIVRATLTTLHEGANRAALAMFDRARAVTLDPQMLQHVRDRVLDGLAAMQPHEYVAPTALDDHVIKDGRRGSSQ